MSEQDERRKSGILSTFRKRRDQNYLLAQLELLSRSDRIDLGQVAYVFKSICRSEYASEWPFIKIGKLLETALDAGFDKQSEAELKSRLLEIFTESGRPIGLEFSDGCIVRFERFTFCFTGEFSSGTRASCRRVTEHLGGIFKETVIQNLGYLVVGSNSSPNWRERKYGTKIVAAMGYNRHRPINQQIKIISEDYWLSAIEIEKIKRSAS